MESYLNNQELAVVLAEVRMPALSERTVNKLISNFLPAIKQLSSTYPSMWKEDLMQEGKIALLNAAQKFSTERSISEFFNYAYTAIKNRLIRFFNSLVKNQPKTVELVIADDDDDSDERRLNFSDDYEIVTTREKAIDIKMHLSDEALAAAELKPKEIQAFRLYFIHDLNLTEVADELGLSDTQASRLMNSARYKIKQVLN